MEDRDDTVDVFEIQIDQEVGERSREDGFDGAGAGAVDARVTTEVMMTPRFERVEVADGSSTLSRRSTPHT